MRGPRVPRPQHDARGVAGGRDRNGAHVSGRGRRGGRARSLLGPVGAPHGPPGGVSDQPAAAVPEGSGEGRSGPGVGGRLPSPTAAVTAAGLASAGQSPRAQVSVELGSAGSSSERERGIGRGQLHGAGRSGAVRYGCGGHRQHHLTARLTEVSLHHCTTQIKHMQWGRKSME